MILKFSLLFLFIYTLSANAQESDDYQLGNGIQLANLPVYIGGYTSLDSLTTAETSRYRVDDLALLSYGDYNRFSYMLEIEFKELYKNSDANISHNTNLYAERLYIDYIYNENFQARVGKYNSPIGFWNLLPINILRETTSNPMTSTIIFPRFTTGADLTFQYGDNGRTTIDFIIQDNHSLDKAYNNYNTNQHYAIGLGYNYENYTFKLNLGNFYEEDTQQSLSYLLLSTQYNSEKFQILGELGRQEELNTGVTTEYALYLQSLYRITPKHIAVARYETYKNNVLNTQDNIGIIAYTYRPLYPIALKSEYQFHSNSSNQLLFSLSIMF